MSRQIDKKTTKQIRIDAQYHKHLKILSANEQRSIKELVEACLAEWLPGMWEVLDVKH